MLLRRDLGIGVKGRKRLTLLERHRQASSPVWLLRPHLKADSMFERFWWREEVRYFEQIGATTVQRVLKPWWGYISGLGCGLNRRQLYKVCAQITFVLGVVSLMIVSKRGGRI